MTSLGHFAFCAYTSLAPWHIAVHARKQEQPERQLPTPYVPNAALSCPANPVVALLAALGLGNADLNGMAINLITRGAKACGHAKAKVSTWAYTCIR